MILDEKEQASVAAEQAERRAALGAHLGAFLMRRPASLLSSRQVAGEVDDLALRRHRLSGGIVATPLRGYAEKHGGQTQC